MLIKSFLSRAGWIGNDVWIGHGAVLLRHVRIGHGAVVGALSVVTKDVPPYAIVAGNPARIIRYRFTESQIVRLLKSEWWNLPIDTLRQLVPFSQVDEFLQQIDICTNKL